MSIKIYDEFLNRNGSSSNNQLDATFENLSEYFFLDAFGIFMVDVVSVVSVINVINGIIVINGIFGVIVTIVVVVENPSKHKTNCSMLQPENKQKNEKKVVNLDSASDGLENSRSKTPKTFVEKKCEVSLPEENLVLNS